MSHMKSSWNGRSSGIDKVGIEKRARELQLAYWDSLVTNTNAKPSPFEVTNPQNLIEYLGIRYIELPEIHNPFDGTAPGEVGGLVDKQQNLIAISTKFGNSFQLFTAAHELGHHVLHDNKPLYRDPPRQVDDKTLPQHEREANYFAACILMPRGLLLSEFSARFGRPPFVFDENSCHHLGCDDSDLLLRPHGFNRELALARARQFGHSHHFESLCSVFNVSPATMAFRLRELGLIRYP